MTARRLAAAVLVCAVLWSTKAAAQEMAEEPTVFPAGEHRDEVFTSARPATHRGWCATRR